MPAAGHVAWLDGWRGLCILLVLLGHFAPRHLGHLAPLGVEMFFVLSGRLMAELLIVRRQALPSFALRRASRILPLLMLYVGVIGTGLALAGLIAGTAVNWLSIVASLLFFSNYLSDPSPLLEHTWSLAVEEHSYLLLLLVAGISARKPGIAAWLAFALAGLMLLNGALLFHAGHESGPYVFWRSDVRGASVLLSFALFLMLRQWKPTAWAPVLPWLSPACLLLGAASMIPADPVTPLQMTACTVFAVIAVNTIEFAAPAYRRLLSTGLLTWLGLLSFSIYIWQQPFFLATKAGFPAILALPLVLACAIWSYARVEAPARQYLNRRWGETRTGMQGPASAANHAG
ncbi:acyltransferase [Sphingomonas sp. R-74633]|uniref:acyltransferase family protein n=1 Tax=Sphingomonas sp. R-74633 TaxID=2751188 RepID=UPI0015D2E3FC|nr:acyltransferase [Sphingomonas sp. R-74633]NYT41775.1 acyltransferase [Sphingomonas sp. R-74633]